MSKKNKIPAPVAQVAGEETEVKASKQSVPTSDEQPSAHAELRDKAREEALKAKAATKSEEEEAEELEEEAKVEVKSVVKKKLAMKPAVDKKIKVVAFAPCYYNGHRKKAGMKFTIRDMSEFSANCMELL